MIGYIYKKDFSTKRFDISVEQRKTSGMGRFGGGWNWKVGAQWSKRTVIFSLFVMSIRISKRKGQKDAR